MFCYECGAQVADGIRFCPICGSPLPSEDEPLAYHDAGGARPVDASSDSSRPAGANSAGRQGESSDGKGPNGTVLVEGQQTDEGKVAEILAGENFDGVFTDLFDGGQPKTSGWDAASPVKPSDGRVASRPDAQRKRSIGDGPLAAAFLFVMQVVFEAFFTYAGVSLVYIGLTGQVRSEVWVTPVLIAGVVFLFLAAAPIVIYFLQRRK